MRRWVLVLTIGVVVLVVAVLAVSRPALAPETPSVTPRIAQPDATPRNDPPLPAPTGNTAPSRAFSFTTQKKSAHFEGSTPAHESVLAAPPVQVVIDVNFDLADNSSITVTRGGQDVGVGATSLDANRLAMRRAVSPDASDGLYTVTYRACWPDRTCHDGQFQFAVDRTRAEQFIDLRGRHEVAVRLKDIAFAPASIRISRGTTVVWTNDDTVEHYVNTDSHPSHTYFPEQNSRALKTGDTYRLTFATPGIYPYHCSAHADTMTASILVE